MFIQCNIEFEKKYDVKIYMYVGVINEKLTDYVLKRYYLLKSCILVLKKLRSLGTEKCDKLGSNVFLFIC